MFGKTTFIFVGIASLVTVSASAQSSFVDFSGWTDGQTSGTAPWAGFGTVGVNITYTGDGNGVNSQGTVYPRTLDVQGDLAPYDAGINPGLAMVPGRIPGTTGAVGVEATYTFNGGAPFPADSVFYASDLDNGSLVLSAFSGGVALDTSGWFTVTVQSRSDGFSPAATWNAATSSLEGNGNGELHVAQFVPLAAFDTLVFTQNSSVSDRVMFNIGNQVVPEPSAVLLASSIGAFFMLRRRRSSLA